MEQRCDCATAGQRRGGGTVKGTGKLATRRILTSEGIKEQPLSLESEGSVIIECLPT